MLKSPHVAQGSIQDCMILMVCWARYALFVTSDHGNAEVMLTEDGKPVTSHTTFPVPFIGYDPAGEVWVHHCRLYVTRKLILRHVKIWAILYFASLLETGTQKSY